MEKVSTHYDNLKVSRDAPDFVIVAAYRTLSQRYHPDKNHGDERAARVMSIINQSYEVLSDPERRRAHDEWISRAEAKLKAQRQPGPTPAPGYHTNSRPSPQPQPSARPAPQPTRPPPSGNQTLLGRITGSWLTWVLVVGGLVMWSAGEQERTRAAASKSKPAASSANRAPASSRQVPRPESPPKPVYIRPATAPNGSAWPTRGGYVAGYPVDHANGHSSVTIDNTRNDADVYLKLVALGGAGRVDARHVYIPRSQRFKMDTVSPGMYDIRYRDLDSGAISGSEKFEIEEVRTRSGIQYSDMTMTLYKVAHGNFDTFALSEDQF